MKSVVLFSGGLDSTTLLALSLSKGEDVYPLTVSYGQRHDVEIKKARLILKKYNIENKYNEIVQDLSFLNDCSLINSELDVPEELSEEIPSTYVPARNIIFLSIATSYAEAVGAGKIYIGVNAIDYSGYPDCRPEFIEAFQTAINKGSKYAIENGIKIETPLLNLSKAEIIKMGINLGVDYSMTHSCYNPSFDGKACGKCDSCRLRHKGFTDAGMEDPTIYFGGSFED